MINRYYSTKSSKTEHNEPCKRMGDLAKDFTRMMRNVPQPVVVVTSAKYNAQSGQWHKRGLTCSSFTSISLSPPIVSFAVMRPSRMHQLLLETQHFAVHVLSSSQVGYGVQFATLYVEGEDQFEGVDHHQDEMGIPIIAGTTAVLKCRGHSVTDIGDHDMWYGEVLETNNYSAERPPLLYYMRSFRTVGDEMFMEAFENRTLPFEQWTHKAHLRMAWNYIKDYGPENAIRKIKGGIQKYNEKNKDKISRGYNDTVTTFYTIMVSEAMSKDPAIENFNEFLAKNLYLQDRNLLWRYYSKELINSPEAAEKFVEPDLEEFRV